jgi:hypothetical protein
MKARRFQRLKAAQGKRGKTRGGVILRFRKRP